MKFNNSDIPVSGDAQLPHDAMGVGGRTGTLQDIRLSFGSCGQQYSTIDGQEFITWFDVRNPALTGLQPGCRVEYETRPAPTVLRHCPRVEEPLPSATLLRVLPETRVSTPHPGPLPTLPPTPHPAFGHLLPIGCGEGNRGGEGERRCA